MSQGDFVGPQKLSSHGIYISIGCKLFRMALQLFYGNAGNSNKPLKNENKTLEMRY